MTRIKFDNISFGYNKKEKILKSLTFDIEAKTEKGYVCALMGESGSGKSTILKLILDLLTPYSGKIEIYPQNPIISYLPQESVLFEHLSPLENAKYFSTIKYYKNRFDSNVFEEVSSLLELSPVLYSNKEVSTLSGGEKQRIALLRALSIRPKILLLDEPCTGLDIRVKYQFLIGLKELIERYNLFVIYVTHLKDEVELIANDVLYLMLNRDAKCVDSTILDSVSGFMDSPKNCEAGHIFHLPKMSLIRCNIDIDNNISLQGKDNYLLFSNEAISYDTTGLAYQIIASTDLYLFLELCDSKDVIITTSKDIANKGYLNISGNALLYNKDKIFERKIQINHNQI